MRSFIKQVIIDTAVRAGISRDAVMDQPEKENITLPGKRLQLEYMSQGLDYSPAMVARGASTNNPATHRTLRKRLYKTDFLVRAEVKSDDETWLEGFVLKFLAELPRKIADPDNNLVVIEANKAVRKGFGARTVEVFKKRSNALHIRFKGIICKDRDVPLIPDVNIKDNTTYKEQGK